MANQQHRHVGGRVLKTDAKALAAIKKISDYKPSNTDYTLTKLQAAADAWQEADDTFAQAEVDWKIARDAQVAAEWAFHNALLGAKKQVIAQYGDDADQTQAVGLKKKSERAKPAQKKTASKNAA